MRRTPLALLRSLPLALLCALLLALPARADSAPKPDLTVTVVNAPEGECYVDLLYQSDGGQLFSEINPEHYDSQLLSALHALEGDGWALALSSGTGGAPIFGDLTPDSNGEYVYSYHGLPDTFRLAVATSEGAQAVEQPYTRQLFHTVLVYDWATNTAQAVTPSLLFYLAQLCSTLVPTLVIEGLILLAFGFRKRRTWLMFLLVNVVTQVGLHLYFATRTELAQMDFDLYLLMLFPAELIIFLVELFAYDLLWKEHSPSRRALYALCANAASFTLGFFPMHWVSTLL